MNESVCKITGLTKVYGRKKVLNAVSLTLEPGKIYGLIGQNGAGKTTLMRIIAGLSYASEGTLELFGVSGEKNLEHERQRIGCMIEEPALVPRMTAKENLRFYRLMRGVRDERVEDDLLALVGLRDAGDKKVQDFSFGMKQRLGIAVTLIGDPDLLILDEPLNGLDPVGIVEMRNLLINLCVERHVTIFLSSHNLPELYQTATDYLIIHYGRIKQTFTLAELRERCSHFLNVNSDQPERMMQVFAEHLPTARCRVLPDGSVNLYEYPDQETVAKLLFANGVVVTDLSVSGESLEEYYVSIVGGKNNVC
ncbi:MAG: ABC transporter ATP-binding protein [Methanocorpusculum sp.]|nr:ABC transporter ATP-binding protein [Methanocorpusculum sp.]